jgi:hypothetical protein
MPTEDNQVYLEFVYDLAIKKGYNINDAINLSEMALYKKLYEGITYSKKHEKQLQDLLMGEHH